MWITKIANIVLTSYKYLYKMKKISIIYLKLKIIKDC